MEEAIDFESLVDSFMAVTGSSDANVAGYYLEACNGDLDRAIDYFYQHPPTASANPPATIGEGLSVQGAVGGFATHADEDEDIMVRKMNN